MSKVYNYNYSFFHKKGQSLMVYRFLVVHAELYGNSPLDYIIDF